MMNYKIDNRADYMRLKKFVTSDSYFYDRCILKTLQLNSTEFSLTLCFSDKEQVVHCCEAYQQVDDEILNEGILLNSTKTLHIIESLVEQSKSFEIMEDEPNFKFYQTHYNKKIDCNNLNKIVF